MKYGLACLVSICTGVLVGCGQPNRTGPSTDTESHWLASCASSSACPDGAECICGVCSTPCGEKSSCDRVEGPASCVSAPDAPETCPRLADEGACLESCQSDAACRERDPALACVDGSCTRTLYEPLQCPSDAPGDERIDLGDEGLSEGDTIDSYLESHLEDGAEVHVPPGTYQWNGGGLEQPLDYASLVGDGEVVLEMPDDYEFRVKFVTRTRFEVWGITFRGRAGADGGFAAFATSPGGRITLRDVALPDGSVSAQQSGLYVAPDHAGRAYFIDLEIQGFASAGLKAYPAAISNDGAGGSVHVVGGRYRNNNVANLWLGPSDSLVRGVFSIQDGTAPSEPGNPDTNQRGIWIDQPSDAMTIEKSDFVQQSSAAAAIVSSADSSGTIRNVRIRNDLEKPAVNFADGSWSGTDLDITGSGGARVRGGSDIDDICTGSGCDSPRSSPRSVCTE